MRRVTTWEYMTLLRSEDGAPERLDQLGAQGWEAYAVIHDVTFLKRETGTLVLAARPPAEDTEADEAEGG